MASSMASRCALGGEGLNTSKILKHFKKSKFQAKPKVKSRAEQEEVYVLKLQKCYPDRLNLNSSKQFERSKFQIKSKVRSSAEKEDICLLKLRNGHNQSKI